MVMVCFSYVLLLQNTTTTNIKEKTTHLNLYGNFVFIHSIQLYCILFRYH